MRLNLKDIINVPGSQVPFDFEPDLSEAAGGSVKEVLPGARAVGKVSNNAGVLTFSAELTGQAVCVCARCLKEFTHNIHMHVKATIADGDQESDDPDMYFLEGNEIDADEIVYTAFVLNMEEIMLCDEDCKGLCHRCGADLNLGPCSCKSEIDPRLAVLTQLLEKE